MQHPEVIKHNNFLRSHNKDARSLKSNLKNAVPINRCTRT